MKIKTDFKNGQSKILIINSDLELEKFRIMVNKGIILDYEILPV